METYLTPGYLIALVNKLNLWLQEKVFTTDTLLQTAIVAVVILAAFLLTRPLRRRIQRLKGVQDGDERIQFKVLRALCPVLPFIAALILLQIAHGITIAYGLSGVLFRLVTRLVTAWVIIRLTTALLKDGKWSRLIAAAAYTVAVLHILNLLDPAISLLERIGIDLGGVRISVLLLVKGVIVFTVLLKVALGVSALLEKRLMTLGDLTPSVQVLLNKGLKVTLLVVAVVASFSSLGINLSAFAFIGGAIGVGIGFGLQKVVSNLISGIILLLDKSIKPGDVIQVGDSYGRIQSLGARYVSVLTRDGFEYLIPNEDLITQQVINWSFSDKLVRLKIGVGVSYSTDIHKAMDLIAQTAKGVRRVLGHPQPVCQLKNFGDSSVDLELRVWISDPEQGISNVASDVRVAIWDIFQQRGIEIPFPQRDLHIKSTQGQALPQI